MELICGFVVFFEGDLYTCSTSSANITEPRTRIRAIRGDHRKGKDNSAVLRFYFHDTIVRFVPRNLNTIFKNLVSLHIQNCCLKKISRDDLMGYEKLEELWLSRNHLTALPDDLFVNMRKLKRISFDNNDIEFMSSNLIKPILKNGVKILDFSKNARIDVFYEPVTRGSLTTLEELSRIIDSQCLKPQSLENSIFLQNHLQNFGNLLATGEFTDFTLNVQGKKVYHVHKCILAAQSEGFAELFKSDPKLKEFRIDDMSPEVVEDYLRYFYTGEVS